MKYITKKELYNIFKHYKKTFKLKLDIDIYNDYGTCNYNPKTKYIEFSIDKVLSIKTDIQKRSKTILEKQLIIFSLLHELRHAIDCQLYEKRQNKELANLNLGLYNSDRKYHHSRPFEIRADKFARQEIKKWI